MTVVIPRDTLFALGDSVLVTATAKNAAGAVIADAPFSWSASSAGVATLSGTAAASITAVSAGNGVTILTARSGSAQGSATLAVRQRVARMTVNPTSVTVSVGQSATVGVSVFDARGNAVGNPGPVYTSSDPSIVSVSGGGVVTGVAAGTATVTASLASPDTLLKASIPVTVNAVATFPVSADVTIDDSGFTASIIDIARGGTVTWAFRGTVSHNVTSTPGGPLHSPTQAIGTFAFTFATAGTFSYLCTIHPFMTGKIIVH